MGCSSPQNAAMPNIPQAQLNRVLNNLTQLLQIGQINHPLNVNKKYEYLARVDTTRETGSGYRKVTDNRCRRMCMMR